MELKKHVSAEEAVAQNAPTRNKVCYKKSCGETKRKKERLEVDEINLKNIQVYPPPIKEV